MPRLVSPLSDAAVPYHVTFEWGRVPGAAGYTIQVSENQEFAGPLLVARSVGGTRLEVDLPAAGPLWWRVCPRDAGGTAGTWSDARRFLILPPPLAPEVFAVAINPPRVRGGVGAEGVVTLIEPAPAGGVTVPLSASDGRVKLPPRVLIAAGRNSARFPVATDTVETETPVEVTAASAKQARSATLTLAPPRPRPRLSSVAINPALIVAGDQADGTVALGGPVPANTLVLLASGDAARVSVPPTIVVPAGASAAAFPVRTAHDNSSGAVTITASLDGVAQSAVVTLRGAASMSPLAAPVPLAPGQGAIVSAEAAADFTWSAVIGAATYTLEVDASGTFTSPQAMTRVLLAPSVAIGPLPAGTVWWRVRANDERGAPGAWSPVRVLRVQ